MTDLSNRSPEEIQSEIAATRHALDRKLDELGHRLDPHERIEELKARANDRVEDVKARASDVVDAARAKAGDILSGARGKLADTGDKLHPRNLEPYVGWMAVGAVVGGTLMAISGWRRVQAAAEEADNYIVGTDVTILNTTDLGDLPPAP